MSAPKIFNDPVYGFISVSDPLIQKLIDHPYFQRLARISQVGLSDMVYPGAQHTRFHHALGAMHLMQQALSVLKTKGVSITENEMQAAQIAILLHDVGHGPFSHTLENTLISEYSHEDISLRVMQLLNKEFHHTLETAIAVFKGEYHKPFLHKLVSGQLDVDRLDYLMRDSFFTGVAEGVIGSERIIKMMNVVGDDLVVEEKGIYSIEKFLIARRLMYWQVYLHKTVIGAEVLLTNALRRAKELAGKGQELFGTSALKCFLYRSELDKLPEEEKISNFLRLDDHDVVSALKEWVYADDKILSDLCGRLMHRRLLKVKLRREPYTETELEEVSVAVMEQMGISKEECGYYIYPGMVSNIAYDSSKEEIRFRMKSGELLNLFDVSDHLDRANMTRMVKKYFICYPKEIKL